MNLTELTRDTIEKAREAILGIGKNGDLAKAVDLSTGLTGTPLDKPAKLLVPLLSPFRQSIGRRTEGGKSFAYKKITAATPPAGSGIFVAEATKAGVQSFTLTDVSGTFRSYGLGDNISWEAEIAGRNFEDAKARSEALLTLQMLKQEELVILGGNRTALGTPTGLATATATTGGTIAAATYQLRVAALTLEGMSRVSKVARPSAGNAYDATTAPTLDASYGITAAQANVPVTTTGSTSTITATWTAIAGACGYALYVDNKLQAVTTQTEIKLTAINTSGAAVPAGDSTASTTAFDGIIPQLADASAGSYRSRLNNPFSAAVGNQIPEIAGMITDIYDRTKVFPSRLVMGWQEHAAIDAALSSVANDRININYSVGPDGPKFQMIKFYPSPINGQQIPIEENPNLPGGMILALIDDVPYPNSQIPMAWEMRMGSDLIRLDYAMTAPKSEYEIRAFGALAGYAPALQGMLYDIHRF